MRDCLNYYINEKGNLVVEIIDEREVEEILDTNSTDLYNFYYLTDLEKENGGFYFTTLSELNLGENDDTCIFLEHWFQSNDGKFFFSGRIWEYRGKEYSALADLLFNKFCVFEFSDRIIDIENIDEVSRHEGITLNHEEKYIVYESIMNRKYEGELRKLGTYEFIKQIIMDLQR